ncbi:ribosome silencing factor [bacterium]|nr:ribosome silencing factor [bacterium]
MEKIVKYITEICNEKKAIDPILININEFSSFAENILIISANNRQMTFLADEIVKGTRKDFGIEPLCAEGKAASGWILVDYGHFVINIMTPECREYYNLEKLWSEGKIIKLESK